MTIAERTVAVTWGKALVSGQGTLNGGTSGALDGLPLTWASRTESPEGKTSPEEPAAEAHSGCFAMALALRLGEHRIVPTRLDVAATVTLAAVGGIPTVVSSNLRVGHGRQDSTCHGSNPSLMRPPRSVRFPDCSPGPRSP